MHVYSCINYHRLLVLSGICIADYMYSTYFTVTSQYSVYILYSKYCRNKELVYVYGTFYVLYVCV